MLKVLATSSGGAGGVAVVAAIETLVVIVVAVVVVLFARVVIDGRRRPEFITVVCTHLHHPSPSPALYLVPGFNGLLVGLFGLALL